MDQKDDNVSLERLLFDRAADPHLILDQEKIIRCNQAALDMLGLAHRDELIGHHPKEFSPEFQFDGRRSDEKARELMQIILEKGCHRFDWLHQRSEGASVYCEVQVNQISSSPNPSFLVVWHDLSERHSEQEELKWTKNRLELALTGANVGLWDWDVITNEVFFSDQLHHQLGEPLGNMKVFDDWRLRVHSEDIDQAIQRVERAFNDPRYQYESVFRMKHYDGSFRWILSRGQIYRNESGEPIRFLGIHIDVTEQKQYEQQLDASNEELKQFAYAASHDLQQPLRAISNYAEFLKEDYSDKLGSEGVHFIEHQISSAKRMKRLIDDLLQYSRVNNNVDDEEPVDMNDATGEAVEQLVVAIKESGAVINYTDLPIVKGSKSRLTQLMQNLIGNAIKYRSEKPPCISISADEDEAQWVFKVSDNGIGITEQFHEEIFQVFRRLHDGSKIKGTGIGLALCKRIVHNHHGKIWVENSSNKGTQMCFSIAK